MKTYLICTGGTGGHIFPILHLYEELKKNYETKIITDDRAEKYFEIHHEDIIVLPSESPFRKKNILHLIKSLFVIFYSLFKSIGILIKYKPYMVVGSGGYVSFPLLLACVLLRKQFILYETNAVLGRVNRFFLSFTYKILSGYEHLKNFPIRYQNKFYYVGNLIRKQFLNLEKKKIDQKDDFLKVLILGGSQGAKIFGEKLHIIFKKLIEQNFKISVIQQVVFDQKESLDHFYEIANDLYKDRFRYKTFIFEKKIEDLIYNCDIVICRSGSSTISELIFLKKTFIAVPLPSSMDNHQFYNADYYVKKDCCWLVNQNEEFSYNIEKLLTEILNDRSLLEKKEKNIERIKTENVIKSFLKNIE